jgi:hypothetical protein
MQRSVIITDRLKCLAIIGIGSSVSLVLPEHAKMALANTAQVGGGVWIDVEGMVMTVGAAAGLRVNLSISVVIVKPVDSENWSFLREENDFQRH